MDMNKSIQPRAQFKTVDEYLSALPKKARDILKALRQTIKQAAPEAEEMISYQMPAFKFHKMLVYYAAHKVHIGFYPASRTVREVFKDELATHATSKGTIRFPMDKPIPLSLVKKIVKHRVNENLEKVNLPRERPKKAVN